MKRSNKILILIIVLLAFGYFAYRTINTSSYNPNKAYYIGQPIDSLNGVMVYYNALVGHTSGRNLAPDGYNLGMKYQCVEFVKRYYYQRLGHKMPDTYGNAKDFFNNALKDSSMNAARGLLQFANGSHSMPQEEDLLIFDGHIGNKYGHVAIVAEATDSSITIIQQNPGPFAPSRVTIELSNEEGRWRIENERALGWLRKPDEDMYYFCINDSQVGGVKTPRGRIVVPPVYRIPYNCGQAVTGEIILRDTALRYNPAIHQYPELILDRNGKYLYMPFFYDNGPDYFEEGYRRFVENGKLGFADRFGRKVIPAKYPFATQFAYGYSIACNDCSYQRISNDPEHCCTWVGNSYSLINRKGEEVYQFTGTEFPEVTDSLLGALNLRQALTAKEKELADILLALPEVKEYLSPFPPPARVVPVVAGWPSGRSPYYLIVLRATPVEGAGLQYLISPDGKVVIQLNRDCEAESER